MKLKELAYVLILAVIIVCFGYWWDEDPPYSDKLKTVLEFISLTTIVFSVLCVPYALFIGCRYLYKKYISKSN